MLKLRPIKSNVTELTINDKTIMFSYQTPVAGYDDQGAFRTDTKYSVTTSRQINQYLGGKDVGRVVSQSYIDSLYALVDTVHANHLADRIRPMPGDIDD